MKTHRSPRRRVWKTASVISTLPLAEATLQRIVRCSLLFGGMMCAYATCTRLCETKWLPHLQQELSPGLPPIVQLLGAAPPSQAVP